MEEKKLKDIVICVVGWLVGWLGEEGLVCICLSFLSDEVRLS